MKSQLQKALALAFFCTMFAYAQYELVERPLHRLLGTRSDLSVSHSTPSSQPAFSQTGTGNLRYPSNISRMTRLPVL
jgi:hypothetical protein